MAVFDYILNAVKGFGLAWKCKSVLFAQLFTLCEDIDDQLWTNLPIALFFFREKEK